MNNNFLLKNETAKKLYEDVKQLPIIDYHCHLSAEEILANKPYDNISKMWLSFDHYKWRLMRVGGVDEHYITGDASDYEKFEKYMQTLIYAINSPLYHWSKMELEKYFGVTDELLPQNIKTIYEKANSALEEEQLSPHKILKMSNVEKICIVEDALKEDLSVYSEITKLGLLTSITPIFRADKLVHLSLAELETKVPGLIKNFQDVGCTSADLGIEYIDVNDEILIQKISYILSQCYDNNFVVQIHLGPMRNNNLKMFERIGPDKGYDSISERDYLSGLVKVFNTLNKVGKTILFNLNPADNYKIATFACNFAGGGIKGLVQMGAAWWFNDNKDGIVEFFKTWSNSALLSSSVGMLTDSRSILSYTRHDYFRRLLCNFIGEIAENGEFTNSYDIILKIVSDVSYNNIKSFLS